MKLQIPEPVSGGLFLTYKCTSQCRHCMYACSPRWKTDWISHADGEKVLAQLAKFFRKRYPAGFSRVGVNLGLHFTGGEPFLNFNLLLDLVKIADRLEIPSTFVETNCFWSVDNETTIDKLTRLRDAGLGGILVSVNPFILEYVPFDRTKRTIRIGNQVFNQNMMVYQEPFQYQFERLDVNGTMPFEEYLERLGTRSLRHIELVPMGRTCYRLGSLYQKYPAASFFSESCMEELTRPWHIHVDNYCNYITGYCAGMSLGDARNLDSICGGIELDDNPIIAQLVSPNGLRELYKFSVKEFSYRELEDGYVSKCHLCIDMRKRIIEQTEEFRELRPKEFYDNLQELGAKG